MGLLIRKKLDQRQLEVTPHPLAQDYAKVEIDVPCDIPEGKGKKISVLSVISGCLKQLRDPSWAQKTPTLPSNQKYGRVYCRVRTASVDAAAEILKLYLVEMKLYLKHRSTIPLKNISIPFKCRRGKHYPALLVMRWCEGRSNRLCLSPMTFDIPELEDYDILLGSYEEEIEHRIMYEKYAYFAEHLEESS
ncbi:hypothetical protein BBP40_004303 [Aspergillus hancockii]|nr:hypothetical protein BBP40_004303 [Aspergillus hancockii]